MKKILHPLFCLLAILLPIIGFAQTDGDYSNLLQFLKGDGAFEKWFMEVFTKLDNSVQGSAARLRFGRKGNWGFRSFDVSRIHGLANGGWRPGNGKSPMLKPILIGFTLRVLDVDLSI